MRSTLANAARQARMGSARATVREFDDDHLMQEVKQADVYHSESPTSFERFQPVGMTAFPIKQQEDPNQKKPQEKGKDETGDWNHDQPTGPAAEAVMLYLNGQRSHPIAFVDDRRVRPYGMSEGEGANYAPDGSEQMVLFKGNGTYVVSLDGKSVKDPKGNETRMASLRHVNKKMQTHKIEKKKEGDNDGGGAAGTQASTREGEAAGGGGQQEKYKHEGESVNTEIRCVKDRIEFRSGDTVVGYYEKSSETWFFKGKIAKMEFSESIETKAPNILNEVSDSFQTYGAGESYIGYDTKNEKIKTKIVTLAGPAKKSFSKAG
jgi:phage gp45-like